MLKIPYTGPLSRIIASGTLRECELWGGSHWPVLVAGLEGAFVKYPDGSLEFYEDLLIGEKRKQFVRFLSLVIEAQRAKRESEGRSVLTSGSTDAHFRGLWGDPIRSYILECPDAAQRGLGENRLIIYPLDCTEFSENEKQRDRLFIGIQMLKKPDDGCRRYISEVVGSWFETVRESGVLGEGPVRPVGGEVVWHGRVASFYADFSASGQATLNWFLLWVVNRIGRYPVEAISLGHPEVFESFFKKKPIREELVFGATCLAVTEEVVGGSIGAENGIEVVRGSDFAAECARIQVMFSEVPGSVQAKEIVDVIRAWLLIGAHGGFGGHMHYHSEPHFDGEVLTVDVDFGTADVEASISVLVKVLGSISREVHCVERVRLTRWR